MASSFAAFSIKNSNDLPLKWFRKQQRNLSTNIKLIFILSHLSNLFALDYNPLKKLFFLQKVSLQYYLVKHILLLKGLLIWMLNSNYRRIVRKKADLAKDSPKSLINLEKIQSSPQDSPSKTQYQTDEKNYFIDQEFMDKMVHQRIIPFVTTQFSLKKKLNQQAISSTKAEALAVRVIFRIISRKIFEFYGENLILSLKTKSFSQKTDNLKRKKVQQFKKYAFQKLSTFVRFKNIRIAAQKVSRVYFKSQIISKNIVFWALKMRAKEKVLQMVLSIQRIIDRKGVINKFQGFRGIIQYANDKKQDFENTRKTIKRVHTQKNSKTVSEFYQETSYLNSQQVSKSSAKQLKPDFLNIRRDYKDSQNNLRKIESFDYIQHFTDQLSEKIQTNIQLAKFRQRLVLRRKL